MPDTNKPPIELGVVLAGQLDAVDAQAAERAIESVVAFLESRFDGFSWEPHVVRREEWTAEAPVEPSDLLQPAREARDHYGWDFAVVVTAADLVSHYKPYTYAVVSKALDVAVLSTSLVDPRASDPDAPDGHRREQIAAALVRMTLYAVGHWLGLDQSTDAANVMWPFDPDIAPGEGPVLTPEQIAGANESLASIADQRLEEGTAGRPTSLLWFYLRAAWLNRWMILDTLRRARPWEFPLRLSRLTTAALSAALVLVMTAETWDMATSQRWPTVIGLFVVSLAATTMYVTVRQGLLLRRGGRPLTEQVVTSNVTAAAIVAVGMLFVYAVLFLLTLFGGLWLFPDRVISGWAASLSVELGLRHYLLMAATVGSLGVLIGALGASFEQHAHFRHVVYVDEEV